MAQQTGTLTKAPVEKDYYADAPEDIRDRGKWAQQQESQYKADVASWTKFQGDIESMKNNSPLKIELGQSKAPKKATDPRGTIETTKLSTGLSSTLGIPTGVQL